MGASSDGAKFASRPDARSPITAQPFCHCEPGAAGRGNPARFQMDCFALSLLAITNGSAQEVLASRPAFRRNFAVPLATDLFDYDLPPHLIAQTPAARRDQSRLLVVDRAAHTIAHHTFAELPKFLRPGDTLFRNNAA